MPWMSDHTAQCTGEVCKQAPGHFSSTTGGRRSQSRHFSSLHIGLPPPLELHPLFGLWSMASAYSSELRPPCFLVRWSHVFMYSVHLTLSSSHNFIHSTAKTDRGVTVRGDEEVSSNSQYAPTNSSKLNTTKKHFLIISALSGMSQLQGSPLPPFRAIATCELDHIGKTTTLIEETRDRYCSDGKYMHTKYIKHHFLITWKLWYQITL